MHPPLASELLLLARVLMPRPEADQLGFASLLLAEADLAHDYFRSNNCCHPFWGDGSLYARAIALSPLAEPMAMNLEFLHALQIAAQALQMHSQS